MRVGSFKAQKDPSVRTVTTTEGTRTLVGQQVQVSGSEGPETRDTRAPRLSVPPPEGVRRAGLRAIATSASELVGVTVGEFTTSLTTLTTLTWGLLKVRLSAVIIDWRVGSWLTDPWR